MPNNNNKSCQSSESTVCSLADPCCFSSSDEERLEQQVLRDISAANINANITSPPDGPMAASGQVTANYSVGEEPFQPMEFSFPARHFGNKNFTWSFKLGWFSQWTWLHYFRESDKAVCFLCSSAIQRNLVSIGRMRWDGNFVKDGFGIWQKAGGKFREHKKSHFHIEARWFSNCLLIVLNLVFWCCWMISYRDTPIMIFHGHFRFPVSQCPVSPVIEHMDCVYNLVSYVFSCFCHGSCSVACFNESMRTSLVWSWCSGVCSSVKACLQSCGLLTVTH